MVWCQRCKMKRGLSREISSEYRNEMVCSSCEREWVNAQRRVDTILPKLSTRLRNVIQKQNITFREVARRVGISEVVLGRYVSASDNATTPGLETFLRICEAIGMRPDEVLGYEDPRLARTQETVSKYGAAIVKAIAAFTEAGVYGGDKLERTSAMDRRETNPYAEEQDAPNL